MYLGRNHVAVPISGIQGRGNGGGFTSSRPNIHFINGSNVGISVVDDAGDDEIEITISSSQLSVSTVRNYVNIVGSVSNGTILVGTSGTFSPANTSSNNQWGFAIAIGGGSSGGALEMIGFGSTRGTGSNQGNMTAYNINTSIAWQTSNGSVWNGGGYSGSTVAFGGGSYAISWTQPSGKSTGVYATSLGWYG